MKIGIDGRALQVKYGGIKRYVFELCKALDKILPHALFYIYSQNPIDMPTISNRWIFRYEHSSVLRRIKNIFWFKLRAGILSKNDKLDIFWGPYTFLPILPRQIIKMITIHDLNHLVVPYTITLKTLLAAKLFFKNDIHDADIILTNSKGTSDRLYNNYRKLATAIVPPSVSKQFRRQPEDIISRCLKNYNIYDPYILSVCTWEPRKNLELLIEAFLEMKNDGLLPNHKLVLVGGRGWKDKKLISVIDNNIGDLIPLGLVPDEHLPPIYAGADVFVFPSIYEGFGIPVLEARCCGTKVVATDIPELREAGGAETVYIQPTKKDIKRGILVAMRKDFDINQVNIEYLTWEQSATIIAEVLERYLSA